MLEASEILKVLRSQMVANPTQVSQFFAEENTDFDHGSIDDQLWHEFAFLPCSMEHTWATLVDRGEEGEYHLEVLMFGPLDIEGGKEFKEGFQLSTSPAVANNGLLAIKHFNTIRDMQADLAREAV